MQRSTDRILTTHTGSLPRPVALEEAMFERQQGAGSSDDLAKLVASAVREVVARQAGVGLDVISDGELGKPSYVTYVSERLKGFGGESGPLTNKDFADFPEVAAAAVKDPGFIHLKRPACIGPVALKDPDAVLGDIELLRASASGVDKDLFMTAVSPATIAMFFENQYYPDRESYLGALADAMRHEYQAIIDAGLTLQVDCPDLGCGHIMYPAEPTDEVAKLVGLHAEVLNHALRGLPRERIRMHVCWGNYPGPHHNDIELKKIIRTVLSVQADGYVVEAANPRHAHEWRVWEDVDLPDGRVVVPGVIDTTSNFIEHPDLVAERIIRYAEVVGRENVLAGTDCGFGTFVGLRAVAPQVAWAKLATLVEGAARASAALW